MRRLIEAIPEAGWTPIEYWLAGGADVAETTYTPFKGEQDAASVRLIVRRVKPTPGSQLALFTRYPATTRSSPTALVRRSNSRPTIVATPRSRTRSVTSSTASGSITCPLVASPPMAPGSHVQVIAHNLARWTARIGLAEGIVTTKTLRRRLFALAGRAHSLCSSAHAPSAGALALGRQLHRRPRPAAGDPAPDLTPLGLADRSTAWRQHACERLPTAVSSCPHARTATVAPCQRHQPAPAPPKTTVSRSTARATQTVGGFGVREAHPADLNRLRLHESNRVVLSTRLVVGGSVWVGVRAVREDT